MHHIEINEKMDASFYQASPAAWQLANDIAKGGVPYESPTLSVNLETLRMPNIGSIQVIVNLELGDAVGIPPNEFDLKLSARNANAMFPRFAGSLRICDEGGTHTRTFLTGEYSVPFGHLGQAMDNMVLKGIAEKSLVSFLRWFVSETESRIERGNYRTAAELMRDSDR